MPNENSFYEAFQLIVSEQNLEEDIIRLYQYELTQGDINAAGALLGLIPDFGYVEKVQKLVTVVAQAEIDVLREKVSTTLMDAIDSIKPDVFETWQEAKAFDECLYSIDGSMLTVVTRERFDNLRQKVWIEWQGGAAEASEIKQDTILAALAEERDKQKIYRTQMLQFARDQQRHMQGFSEQLSKAAGDQEKHHVKLDSQLEKVNAALIAHGIKLDNQTLALLQSDAELAKDLGLVISYLDKKEQQEVQAMLKAQEQFKYEGLAKGFGLLGAVGVMSDNAVLQKISVVGTQGVQIHLAMQQFTGLSGMAVLNPAAAIGMALVSIASAFLKKGPSSHELIMKQMQQIAEQLVRLQQIIQQGFKDVYYHLRHIERTMVLHFRQIQYLLEGPVVRKFDQIQHDLSQLNALVKIGFQEVLLGDLEKQVALVNSVGKTIDYSSLPSGKILETLIALSQWVNEKTYSPYFNGASLFTKEMGFKMTPRQSSALFHAVSERNASFDGIMTPMILIGHQQGWLMNLDAELPHMSIWMKSLAAYLGLREHCRANGDDTYDAKKIELREIYRQAKKNAMLVDAVLSSPNFLEGAVRKVIELFGALQAQYNVISQPHENKWKSFDVDSKDGSDIPAHFSFEYVRGGDASKRRGRQRNFTKENGMTQADCLRIIAAKSIESGTPIFDAALLQADQHGLVEFRCRMHRTMSNGGKQIFETEGKKYGLEICVYIKETQETYHLTEPSSGHAKWKSADKHTTRTTIDSHRAALAPKTKLLKDNIQNAVEKVKLMLAKRSEQAKLPFYQVLIESFLKDDSILYQLSMYINLIKCFLMVSPYELEGAPIDSVSSQIATLTSSSLKPDQSSSQAKIENFLKAVPGIVDTFERANLVLPIAKALSSECQTFNAGVQTLLAFDPELAKCSFVEDPSLVSIAGAARYTLAPPPSRGSAPAGTYASAAAKM